MGSLVEIAQAMQSQIEQAVAAAADPPDAVQVSYVRNINPTPPCIDIFPGDPFDDGDAAGFGGAADECVFTVRARIGTADNTAGQELLLAFMDEQDDLSVKNALQADQKLGGAASSILVIGPTGHRIYEDSAHTAAFLGVEWRVKVLR